MCGFSYPRARWSVQVRVEWLDTSWHADDAGSFLVEELWPVGRIGKVVRPRVERLSICGPGYFRMVGGDGEASKLSHSGVLLVSVGNFMGYHSAVWAVFSKKPCVWQGFRRYVFPLSFDFDWSSSFEGVFPNSSKVPFHTPFHTLPQIPWMSHESPQLLVTWPRSNVVDSGGLEHAKPSWYWDEEDR